MALVSSALENNGTAVYVLDELEKADLAAAVAECERGEFASEDEVSTMLDRLTRQN